MNAEMINLTPEQRERLERAAQSIGKSTSDLLNGLIQEHIEALLEDIEDGAVAQARYERYKAGIDKGISWSQVEAELDSESGG